MYSLLPESKHFLSTFYHVNLAIKSDWLGRVQETSGYTFSAI